MPALRLRTANSSGNRDIMERENAVQETSSDTETSLYRLGYDAEGNNKNNNDLEDGFDSRQNLKDFLLDADEISVIGYTDDNNVMPTFNQALTASTIFDELGEETRDLVSVNNYIQASDAVCIATDAIIETEKLPMKTVINSDERLTSSESNGVETDCSNSEIDARLDQSGSRQQNHVPALWDAVENEPIHMTLEDVQLSLYDWEEHVTQSNTNHVPNKISDSVGQISKQADSKIYGESVNGDKEEDAIPMNRHSASCHTKLPRPSRQLQQQHSTNLYTDRSSNPRSFKHTLCHWLGLGRCASAEVDPSYSEWPPSIPRVTTERYTRSLDDSREFGSSIVNRALPPLPRDKSDGETDGQMSQCDNGDESSESQKTSVMVAERILPDFAESICKVKDCGWYWGPISGEMAEKILSGEPDGSFVVRDSSDERYIFSLTFKLNGFVRHVRIEHDHGNFSFGSFTKFKSHTIVEFIENAVRHSRSGRYLFFLHRRPALGPMRVQLLYPVSRFKRVQSLQHMCRFVILKAVRRDLIACLPLPAKLKNYLDTQQYYTEQMQEMQLSVAASVDVDVLDSTETVV